MLWALNVRSDIAYSITKIFINSKLSTENFWIGWLRRQRVALMPQKNPEVCRLLFLARMPVQWFDSTIYHKNSINFQHPKKLAEQIYGKKKRFLEATLASHTTAWAVSTNIFHSVVCVRRSSHSHHMDVLVNFSGANTLAILRRESTASSA